MYYSTNDAVAGHIRYNNQKGAARAVIADFVTYLKPYNKNGQYDRQIRGFVEFLWGALFSKTFDDQPLKKRPFYQYSAFDMPAQAGWWRLGGPMNVASLFQDFQRRRKSDALFGDEKDIGKALDNIVANIPTSKQRRANRLTTQDMFPAKIAPGVDSRGEALGDRDVTAVLLKPQMYKPSFFASTATSLLLGGVSRIAIMAALGTTGAPMIAAAVVAGIGAGAITSYYKNRQTIAQEVAQETTFWGRMKARWRGFRKSYSTKQFLINTAASSIGVVGGGALFEAVAENVPMPKLASDFMDAAHGQVTQAKDYVTSFATQSGLMDVNLATIENMVTASLDRAMVSAGEASQSIRDAVAHIGQMDGQDVLPPVEVLETSADPLETYASSEGVVVVDESTTPPAVETISGQGPSDVIARAFADVDIPPPLDDETARWMENFAQAYAQASAPIPPNDVLAYTAADLGGAQMIDEQLAAPVEEAVSAIAPETHTIERGDTLWDLTRTYYDLPIGDGDARHEAMAMMVQANPQLAANPSSLKIGQELVMPDLNNPDTLAADCRVVRGRLRSCTPV